MRFARRSLPRLGFGLVAAVAELARDGSGRVIDVREFGALGDDASDDSEALKQACRALRNGDKLVIPSGIYRVYFPNPSLEAALVIDGLHNITVEFEPNAEIRLIPWTGATGPSPHGVLVRGFAERIEICRPRLIWSPEAPKRSAGDGIRLIGYPSDSNPPPEWKGSGGTVVDVSVADAYVSGCPQAGIVSLGCRDVEISRATIISSRADGIHVNRSQNVVVSSASVFNAGDDAFAFVCYFDIHEQWLSSTVGPFSSPSLDKWSNAGCRVIASKGNDGEANGVRIAGSCDVNVSGLVLKGFANGSAVTVDSAEQGKETQWSYQASRRIALARISAMSISNGYTIISQNVGADPVFSEFQVVLHECSATSTQSWGLRVESVGSGVPISGLQVRGLTLIGGGDGVGRGGVRVALARSVSVENVYLQSDTQSEFDIFSCIAKGSPSLVNLDATVSLRDSSLIGASLLVRDCSGVSLSDVVLRGRGTHVISVEESNQILIGNSYFTFQSREGEFGPAVTLAKSSVVIQETSDIDVDKVLPTAPVFDVQKDSSLTLDHVSVTGVAGGGDLTQLYTGDGLVIRRSVRWRRSASDLWDFLADSL